MTINGVYLIKLFEVQKKKKVKIIIGVANPVPNSAFSNLHSFPLLCTECVVNHVFFRIQFVVEKSVAGLLTQNLVM